MEFYKLSCLRAIRFQIGRLLSFLRPFLRSSVRPLLFFWHLVCPAFYNAPNNPGKCRLLCCTAVHPIHATPRRSKLNGDRCSLEFREDFLSSAAAAAVSVVSRLKAGGRATWCGAIRGSVSALSTIQPLCGTRPGSAVPPAGLYCDCPLIDINIHRGPTCHSRSAHKSCHRENCRGSRRSVRPSGLSRARPTDRVAAATRHATDTATLPVGRSRPMLKEAVPDRIEETSPLSEKCVHRERERERDISISNLSTALSSF